MLEPVERGAPAGSAKTLGERYSRICMQGRESHSLFSPKTKAKVFSSRSDFHYVNYNFQFNWSLTQLRPTILA